MEEQVSPTDVLADRYRIEREIGARGMATVFNWFDELNARFER